MADNEEDKPNGVLGVIMPGEMSKANQHNNIEIWKQQKDPTYVPKFIHPKPVELSIPEVDRNADRSGVNGIIKDELQLEKPPVTPDYRIEGRRGDEGVPPMLAMYLKKVAEQKKLKEQEPTEEPKEPTAEPAKEQPDEPQKETPKEYTGCTVLPAFPPWGCQQEPKVASDEPALPAEEPAEGLVPDTMPGIWKLLGFTGESYYDFGIHTISPAGHRPTLEAALKAYRKNMLLVVARALVLKEHGRKFTAEQVKNSAISSWKGNGRIKKYSEVIQENKSQETLKMLKGILDEIPRFIDGKVDIKRKYMSNHLGEVWTINSFVLWCKVGQKITFMKTGWRSSKKG